MTKNIRNMVFCALCIAIGLILPMALHVIPNAGSIFLPMHIPVLLCGLLCGSYYGLLCGLLVPVLSSVLTGIVSKMPFSSLTYRTPSSVAIKKCCSSICSIAVILLCSILEN